MELAFFLLLFWVFVTLAGHGTWVILARVFRGTQTRQRAPWRDVAAAQQVLERLREKRLIDDQQHDTWRNAMVKLLASGPETAEETAAETAEETAGAPRRRSTGNLTPVPSVETVPEPVLVATLVDDPDPTHPLAPEPPAHAILTPVVPTPSPTQPAISTGQWVQSFLDRRNIRWGELVAGMLIVICSIGLVVSLWSTIAGTHRVVPSMMFLAANAAIYAAGFYTLSRWKVRHTSRAVLVIATLLVPLSVLGGLAASGSTLGPTSESVRLDDPITLVAIVVAGLVYLGLVHRGGRALVRKGLAGPMTLAVLGPVAVLPLLPASVRVLGQDAGWVNFLASSSVAVAAMIAAVIGTRTPKQSRLEQRRLEQSRLEQGRLEQSRLEQGRFGGTQVVASRAAAATRARGWVLAMGSFSLAVTVVSGALSVRDLGTEALLPIAASLIPALVAVAAASRSLMMRARSGTQSMAAAVVCVVAMGIVAAAMPPMTVSSFWVWAWAISAGVSGLVASLVFGRPAWQAAATVPIGFAAVFSSPVWIGGRAWEQVGLFSRLLGGEPMLASLAVAVGCGLIAWLTSLRKPADRPTDPTGVTRGWGCGWGWAAAGWMAVCGAIAMGLAVGPPSWSGSVPTWLVTAILAAAAMGSLAASGRSDRSLVRRLARGFAMASSALAWVSLLHPFPWTGVERDGSVAMMLTVAGISATWLALGEADRRFGQKGIAKDGVWFAGSIAGSTVLAVMACGFVSSQWTVSTILIGGATLMLVWSAAAIGSRGTLLVAKLGSLAVAVSIAYPFWAEALFPVSTWQSSVAMWSWAILLASVAAIWFLVAILATRHGAGQDTRLSVLTLPPAGRPAAETGFAAAATGLIVLGATWWFAASVARVVGAPWPVIEGHPVLVLASIAAATLAILAAWRAGLAGRLVRSGAEGCYASVTLWLACWVVGWVGNIPAVGQLVIATSSTGLLWMAAGHRMRSGVAGLATLVSVSSIALLSSGWLVPLLDGRLVDPVSTFSVGIWWVAIAGAMLWRGFQQQRSDWVATASALVPMAALVTTPAWFASPVIVWFQAAALVAIGWAGFLAVVFRGRTEVARSSINTFFAGGFGVGAISALAAIAAVAFPITMPAGVLGWPGFLVSITALSAGWLPTVGERFGRGFTWPLGTALMAGQFAWLAIHMGWVSPGQSVVVMMILVAGSSLGALARWVWITGTLWDQTPRATSLIGPAYWQITATALAIPVYSFWDPSFGGASSTASTAICVTGLFSLVVAGCWVGCAQTLSRSGATGSTASRLLGWWVIACGCVLIHGGLDIGVDAAGHVTMALGWAVTWWCLWRLAGSGRLDRTSSSASTLSSSMLSASMLSSPALAHSLSVPASPAKGLAGCFLVALGIECLTLAIDGGRGIDARLLMRLALYGIVAGVPWIGLFSGRRDRIVGGKGGPVSTFSRNVPWPMMMATGCLMLLVIQVAKALDCDMDVRLMLAIVSAGFAIAMLSHWLPSITRAFGGQGRSLLRRDLLGQSRQVASGVAAAAVFCFINFVADGSRAWVIQFLVVGVAMSAWTWAMLAQWSGVWRDRYVAVGLAMTTLGLWASIGPADLAHPWLEGSMRWLIAATIATAFWLFGAAELMGPRQTDRWRGAFRFGGILGAAASAGSLATMLALELLAGGEGLDQLSRGVVVVVAFTTATLCGLSAAAAILSFRGKSVEHSAGHRSASWTASVAERLGCSDAMRRRLIYAAQALGVITWLHLFLCDSPLAITGLRPYWPFVVMTLAFVSVGLTEWAGRRGDAVMRATLRQTSLFLPLVPVIGFWISGLWSSAGAEKTLDWMFSGEQVRYEWLLVVGAAYYAIVSAIWKTSFSRVGAIVLANAALWVVLVQQPGWGFLAHPQAWMIPPAACVLAISHWYRQRIAPATLTLIRYAATLVIYVSSTADMILQEIGTSIAGPIILVTLALLGMLVGVVLRVRPFLHLGAVFVFLGVTSMVWHAQRSIDAVWPWWVFGIGTGIVLLVGLTVLEKNKRGLRKLTRS